MSQLFAGTSGFSYPAWKPVFYPADLPSRRFLEHYASRLNCVEANYTFRRLLTQSVIESWVKVTPPEFQFGCKAHMRLTHIMKMADAAEFTALFLKSLEPLRAMRRLGPVLFQFSPSFKVEVQRLEEYLPLLPQDIRFAFEFRHSSWLTDAVYKVLERHNVALCLAESEKLQVPKVLTADFTYFRLRKGDYDDATRDDHARQVEKLLAGGRDVYVFYKHEDDPRGAVFAEELLKRVRAAAA